MAPGVSLRSGIPTSLRPTLTITVSMRSGVSRRPSTGILRSSRVAWSLIAPAPPLSHVLASWSERFEEAMIKAMLTRLGVAAAANDRELTAALIRALATKTQSVDRIFFDWRGGHDPGVEKYPQEEFRRLAQLLVGRQQPKPHSYWSDPEPCSMYIDEVEAIWTAIANHDDWQPFNNKVKAIRRMGQAMGQDAPRS